MASNSSDLVDVDWSAFDPWRITPVRHRLMEHPLLQPDQLMELGKRLESNGRVRTHSSGAEAGTPFNAAPRLHPNRMSAAETLRQIRDAKAWMSLLNVQSDPTYRTLVDDVLDGLKSRIDRLDPGMCYRGGWIFITSPNTVTPFHFDKEHNFILQVSGRKTLYVWDHRDTAAASEQSRDRFHQHHERDLLSWNDSLRERATVFHLEPGQGAYMPSTSPHMVESGDDPSITVSFTYYTDGTRRDSLLHRAHERMRAWGLTPPAVGQNAALDACLHASFRSVIAGREWARKLAGKIPRSDGAPYAFTSVH
ncbi:cupin-like domain-containing protein [Rhodanobacter sp. L36]|uniref:cupin-like domain-containing protein n=1 Tax=Rhodanobacter sp. L36 TaxID=1747221 RepID=UPI00131A6D64|nr:cupin-like domain-containing protein [Rhodanobacter sp. L36]